MASLARDSAERPVRALGPDRSRTLLHEALASSRGRGDASTGKQTPERQKTMHSARKCAVPKRMAPPAIGAFLRMRVVYHLSNSPMAVVLGLYTFSVQNCGVTRMAPNSHVGHAPCWEPALCCACGTDSIRIVPAKYRYVYIFERTAALISATKSVRSNCFMCSLTILIFRRTYLLFAS